MSLTMIEDYRLLVELHSQYIKKLKTNYLDKFRKVYDVLGKTEEEIGEVMIHYN